MVNSSAGENVRCHRRTNMTATMESHCHRERRSLSSRADNPNTLARFAGAAKHANAIAPTRRNSIRASFSITEHLHVLRDSNCPIPRHPARRTDPAFSDPGDRCDQHRFRRRDIADDWSSTTQYWLWLSATRGEAEVLSWDWIFSSRRAEVQFKVFIVLIRRRFSRGGLGKERASSSANKKAGACAPAFGPNLDYWFLLSGVFCAVVVSPMLRRVNRGKNGVSSNGSLSRAEV